MCLYMYTNTEYKGLDSDSAIQKDVTDLKINSFKFLFKSKVFLLAIHNCILEIKNSKGKMNSDNMFDLLMEIRKVDRQISEQKSKITQSTSELLQLERNIDYIQKLKLKAHQTILKNCEGKLDNMRSELENVHCIYNKSLEILAKCSTVPNTRADAQSLEELRKLRDCLKKQLLNYTADKQETAKKVNDTELQISIEKKKNAAVLIRLQKDLEESLDEENKLCNQLKS